MGNCNPKNDATGAADSMPVNPNKSSRTIQPQGAKQQAQEENKAAMQEKTSKIIFMGNANVGKTSIINSFMEGGSQRGKKKEATKVVQDFMKV